MFVELIDAYHSLKAISKTITANYWDGEVEGERVLIMSDVNMLFLLQAIDLRFS